MTKPDNIGCKCNLCGEVKRIREVLSEIQVRINMIEVENEIHKTTVFDILFKLGIAILYIAIALFL